MRYVWIWTAIATLFVLLSSNTAHMQEDSGHNCEVISPDNAARLTQLARYGNGMLTGVGTWSPDGDILAVGGSIGIWFYDMSKPAEKPLLLDLDMAVSDLEYSLDGRYLAYSTSDYAAVLDTASGENILRIENGGEIALHPNGHYLAVGMYEFVSVDEGQSFARATVDIWDLNTRAVITSFESDTVSIQYPFVNDLSFSEDGQYLAVSYTSPYFGTCGGDRTTQVLVWDFSDPEAEPIVIAGVEYAVFSPDSQTLVSVEFITYGPELATLQFTSLENGETSILKTMPDSDWGYVLWYGFHPDSEQFVTLTSDDMLRFWDASTQSHIHEHPVDEAVRGVIFSPDGERVALLSETGVVLWTDNFTQQTALPFELLYETISFTDSGDSFAAHDDMSRLHLWRVSRTELAEFFVSEPLDEVSPVLNWDGNYLAYVSSQKLLIWNTPENTLVSSVQLEPHSRLLPLTFSLDSRYLLTRSIADSSTQSSYIQLRDSQTGRVILELEYEPEGWVEAGFSSDGTRLYVKSQNIYEIYDIASGRSIFHYELEQPRYARFSPDLSYLVIVEQEYNSGSFLHALSTETEEELSETVSHSYGGSISQFSLDGRYVMFQTSSVSHCGGDFRGLYVYRLPDMQLLVGNSLPAAAPGEWRGVSGKFSPDGSLFFSVNSLYVTETGEHIVRLPLGDELNMTFTSDGKLVVVNQSGTFRVWGVPSTEE